MADYRYCVGSVARRTTAGAQTVTGIADTTGAFTPKAVLVWGTVQASTGFTSNAYYFMGLTDGTNSHAAGCWANTGDTAPSIAWTNLITYTGFIGIPQVATQTTTAYAASATVTFASGSFTITWSASADTTPFQLNYLVFGGEDLTAEVGAALDAVTTPAAVTTTLTMTEQVTALLTLGVPGTGGQVYAIPTFTMGSWPNLGWANQDLDQGVLASTNGPAGIGNAVAYALQRTGQAQAKIFSNIITLGAVTAMGAGTFTVTYSSVGAATAWTPGAGFFYLALAGPRVAIAAATSPTTAAPATSTLDVAFQAGAVLAVTDGLAASTSTQAPLGWSFGAAAPGGQYANSWIGATNNTASSSTSRGHFTDRLLTMAVPAASASQTVKAVADVTFSAGTAPVLGWSVTDSTARQFLYLTFEGAPPPAPPTPATTTSQIRRMIQSPTVAGDGKLFRHKSLKVLGTPGQGLATGQGVAPKLFYQLSDDGGFTWGSIQEMSLGEQGAYLTTMWAWQLGSSRQRTYRIFWTDPIDFAITTVYLDAEQLSH